jgi:AraC-like DNA-binding protein
MLPKKIKISSPKNTPAVLMPWQSSEELSILWNIGPPATFRIDELEISLNANCIVFISEFFTRIEIPQYFRLIQFQKTFLGPVNSVMNSGEHLLIFYGIHAVNHVPKITLREEEVPLFERIWNELQSEAATISNPVSEALVRNSFQRFLLLSQKIHMESGLDIPVDFKDLKIIREFQYLVNMHFMELTKVADYAKLLNISPKKIAQLFASCYSKKASELIAGRRNLYAKRQLIHSGEPIKAIAYDLNFSDPQAFSHFFKRQNGLSPEAFRRQMQPRLLKP